MKRLLVTKTTSLFMILICMAAISSCNPSQEQKAEDKLDSMQREMEQEMDTAGNKIDSLGDTLKDAADKLLDETGETLEKAGEKLQDEGNN